MADYSIWVLGASDITISGGKSLSGWTQGDGSHLVEETIRLDSNSWQETSLRDGWGDTDFDDNDSDQVLDGAQTIDGTAYSDGTRVEAEYRLTLQDADGNTWDVVGYNLNNSSPSYGTVEGLAFVGEPGQFPPIGVDLTVISAYEGPGSFGQSSIDASDLVSPLCFTTGTMIETDCGPRPVENLAEGDLVRTLDNGLQPIRWIGRIAVTAARLAARPAFRPVRIRAGALGEGRPLRDMLLSQQHRLVLRDWRATVNFGCEEVLVAAVHLANDRTITIAHDVGAVTYFHLMFDTHEIVFADGIEAESFRPGPVALKAIPQASRDELLALFPALARDSDGAGTVPPARPMLRGWETRMLS